VSSKIFQSIVGRINAPFRQHIEIEQDLWSATPMALVVCSGCWREYPLEGQDAQ